jgi:hypothetical protein
MPIRRQPALAIPASRVLAAAQMSHLQHRTEGLWVVGCGPWAVGKRPWARGRRSWPRLDQQPPLQNARSPTTGCRTPFETSAYYSKHTRGTSTSELARLNPQGTRKGGWRGAPIGLAPSPFIHIPLLPPSQPATCDLRPATSEPRPSSSNMAVCIVCNPQSSGGPCGLSDAVRSSFQLRQAANTSIPNKRLP